MTQEEEPCFETGEGPAGAFTHDDPDTPSMFRKGFFGEKYRKTAKRKIREKGKDDE